MTLIKKISYLVSSQHKRELIIITVFLFIGVVFEMLSLGILLPFIALLTDKNAVNNKFINQYFDFSHFDYPKLVIGGMALIFLIFLIKTLFLVYLSWRQSKFSSKLFSDLSDSLFKGYLSQNYLFHTLRNSSELLKNIQIEVDVFSYVSRSAMMMASEFAFILGVTLLLLIVNPLGTSVVIIFFAAAAFVFHRITKKRLLKWGVERQESDENSYKQLTQAFGGIKDVILLDKKNFFLNNFKFYNGNKAIVIAKQNTLQLIPRMYLELLAILALSLLVSISVLQNQGIETILPVVTLFVAAAFRLIPSLNKIMGTMQVFRYARPVIDLLHREFSTFAVNNISVENHSELTFDEKVIIQNLSFTYPESDRFSLNNISLSIKKGDSIGLIGTSGSGKSTLVDIFMGILKPTDGYVLSDNCNIQSNILKWQSKIGYVPQSIFLLDDTLRANIAFGFSPKEIDETRVWAALKLAELDVWVNELPESLDTNVGERGVRLSGGQRQRIGIARALYNDPDILVLDEATSSLDTNTERKIMDSVNSLQGIKTLVIIAHRLSTVESCDFIYKLNNGNIVESGTPSEFNLKSGS